MISITLEDKEENIICTYQTVMLPKMGDIVYHNDKPYLVLGLTFQTNEPTSCGCRVVDMGKLADDAIDNLRKELLN